MAETLSYNPESVNKVEVERKPGILEKIQEYFKSFLRKQAEIPSIQDINVLAADSPPSPKETQELFDNNYKLVQLYDKLSVVGTELSGQKNTSPQELTQAQFEKVGQEWKEGESMTLDNIVFVRCTEYFPIVEGNDVKIITAGEATDGKDPRATLHWTMNHAVEPVDEGLAGGSSWDESSILFLVPGKKMVELNGKPENLLEVDTFWVNGIKLPEGTVVITKKNIPEDLLAKFNEKGIKVVHSQQPRVDGKKTIDDMGYTIFEGGAWQSRNIRVAEAVQKLGQGMQVNYQGVHVGNRFGELEHVLRGIDVRVQEPATDKTYLEMYFKNGDADKFFDRISDGIDYCLEWLKKDDYPQLKKWISLRLTSLLTEVLPKYADFPAMKDQYINPKFGSSMNNLFAWLTQNPEIVAKITNEQRARILDIYKKGIVRNGSNELGDFGYYIYNAIEQNKEKLPKEWHKT